MIGWMSASTLLAVAAATPPVDAHDAGLPWPWLVFGFAAQALFTGRMLIQWLASERAGKSTVPTAFWWMSLAGGLTLSVYFLRRGDPVGVLGQSTGVLIYARNLWLIHKRKPT